MRVLGLGQKEGHRHAGQPAPALEIDLLERNPLLRFPEAGVKLIGQNRQRLIAFGKRPFPQRLGQRGHDRVANSTQPGFRTEGGKQWRPGMIDQDLFDLLNGGNVME